MGISVAVHSFELAACLGPCKGRLQLCEVPKGSQPEQNAFKAHIQEKN